MHDEVDPGLPRLLRAPPVLADAFASVWETEAELTGLLNLRLSNLVKLADA